jgi:hypothetical protein
MAGSFAGAPRRSCFASFDSIDPLYFNPVVAIPSMK